MKYLTKTYEVLEHNNHWSAEHKINTIDGISQLCATAIIHKSTLSINISGLDKHLKFDGRHLTFEVICPPMRDLDCPDYYPMKNAIEAIIKIHRAHS